MAQRFTQDQQYLSISTPLAADTLVLRAIEGEEEISTLFTYRVHMISTNDDIAFNQIVGQSVTVTIQFGADRSTSRYINGIVSSLELVEFDEREGVAHYEAEIRPWPWMLTHSGDCRIFQNQTVPEIVNAVCSGAGYTAIKQSLTATYSPRVYCVQYNETDYNFIARLLEEEGIFYYFSHSNGAHTMVWGDSPSAFTTSSLMATIDYRGHEAYDIDDNIVTSLRFEQRVVTKAVGQNDYDFVTPSTNLYSTASGSTGVGTISDYPGHFTTTSVGENIAKMRLQGLTLPGQRISGAGVCRSLEAGTKVTFADHPKSGLNIEVVLNSVSIAGTLEEFTARFTAFPSTVPYRPRGTATKPRIASTQTALVVGKQGEEIWLDSYGRVNVQFYWDRVGQKNEQSSCWVRVAQPWAGNNYGIMFFPRVGQEVVVTFLDGDPDQPLITGAVYNATQLVPYAQPANSTKSTIKTQSSANGSGKYNEIRFEDKTGSEELFIQAQKDFNVTVLNDNTVTIKHDHSMTVTNDHTMTVSEGNESHTITKGTRTIVVEGAETHTGHATYSQTTDSDHTLTVKGNLTIDVTGDIVIKGKSIALSSTSADIGVKAATSVAIQSGTALTAKSGTSFAVTSGTSYSASAGTAYSVSASMGLTLKASLAFSAQGLSAKVAGDTTAELNGSATATVSGGAMTSIKGGIVQIN
ncbi:MAG: type VI secretion system tip protein TssI/VgrG [Azospirillaceae bacterium]|nr:type VI secretion system tip protein TssI/VgrG [Azospirillaceae bacterium]